MRLHYTALKLVLVLAWIPSAIASTNWYVSKLSGNDSNNCMSPETACKTIGHTISLASSGDSVMVAAGAYGENLSIDKVLKVVGSGAKTILHPKNYNLPVVQVTKRAVLSQLTITGGKNSGVFNSGTLTISDCIVSNNIGQRHYGISFGGGIYNTGRLTINNSTITANGASGGGGVYSRGTATINSSTLSGNSGAVGGGVFSQFGGPLAITNSTITGNIGDVGGGIAGGTTVISNSTISGNTATNGGGIANAAVTLRNSIVANNKGKNCYNNTSSSKGYNLSSDNSCAFNNTGDMNNTNPKLGPLQNNGGPTMTMALPSGSPAIDAGNPNGCTDAHGHLLKTDQRGMLRPDKEDTVGCDMGAYEYQGLQGGGIGRCVVTSTNTLSGYCIGTRGGVCREAYDPTNCPPNTSVSNGQRTQCARSSFRVDPTRGCTP